MPEISDTVAVPLGAYQALGWFFENSRDGFLAIEGETVRRVNPVWTRLTGHSAAQTHNLPIWRFVDPEDRTLAEPAVSALAVGRQVEREIRLVKADGERLWVRANFVRGGAGWVLAIVRDITGERRLRESEARFRGLVNATSDVVYRMSPDWREMRALDGRGFLADTETPSGAWMDEYLLPEDQASIRAAIDEAIAREEVFQLEHRVRQADGSTGWSFSRALPIRDQASGEIVEWFGAATDITERRRAEQHLRLMVDELNHRVKNSLAMIEAAAHQAFRNALTLDEARASLTARISALAHATDLVTGEACVGRSLRGVVETAIGAHAAGLARCALDGPALELPAHSAHVLTLAIHELATNAVKHGALSSESGKVEVSWRAAPTPGGRRLHLEWRELGGPRVEPPSRRGFGTRLIERGVTTELGGAVEFHYDPAGLVCVVDTPLAA